MCGLVVIYSPSGQVSRLLCAIRSNHLPPSCGDNFVTNFCSISRLLPAVLSPIRRPFSPIEYAPSYYNANGPEITKERAFANTEPSVLANYGGGEWPFYSMWKLSLHRR